MTSGSRHEYRVVRRECEGGSGMHRTNGYIAHVRWQFQREQLRGPKTDQVTVEQESLNGHGYEPV
ncbi:hypothetical protein PENTCL1PPCAC_25826, partial [Pristionchus entomophagus]